MKKLFIFLVLLTALAFLGGCASLGWKPSADQLNQYQSNLRIANLTESGAFMIFNQFCIQKTLPEKTCVVGYAADAEWDNAYELATVAIVDYKAGKTDEEMMIKYITAAMEAEARIVKLIKELVSSQPTTVLMKEKGKAMAPKPALVPKK